MKKQKSSKRFRKPLLCSISMLLALSVTGCSSPLSRGTAITRATGSEIYVIGQSDGVQFWDFVEEGVTHAGEEFGYNVHYANAASTADIDGQIQLVQKAIDAEADAIVLAPNDSEQLLDIVHKAMDKGIKVVAIDADLGEGNRDSYIGTVNVSAGSIAGRQAFSLLEDPTQDKALIISHSDVSNAATMRVNGFYSTFAASVGAKLKEAGEKAAAAARARAMAEAQNGGAENAGGPPAGVGENAGGPPAGVGENAGGPPAGAGENAGGPPAGTQGGASESGLPAGVAAIRYCNGDADTAKAQAIEEINKNPNIKVIYATNERSTLGVCEAVEELGKAGEIKIVGFNANDAEVNYIKNGTLTGVIVQNPYNMGYLGVSYAGTLIIGNAAPHSVDTGATYVNINNLQNAEVQLLLDPAGFVESAGKK